jgi:peptidyl-prolyl cis-trans isomerase B (cyclophilin B)
LSRASHLILAPANGECLMTNTIARLRIFLIAGCACGLGFTGCTKTPEATRPQDDTRPNAAVQSVNADSLGQGAAATEKPVPLNFNQSFEEAVSTEVLEGQFVPPDLTVAGKKTAQLRAAVEVLWPKIKLIDSAGKPIARTLLVETSEGPIEITLQPELAPNHVRNMLALAQLGFYDGLFFDRTVHQEEPDGEDGKLELRMVIAGCPIGTGDEGYGHLGYFIRAEFQDDLKHAEGTVGFWHEENPDSAGTRFYITLGPAPALDGKFTVVGHVAKGLDVVKRIAAGPVKSNDPSSPDNEKPTHPTSIKKIAIHPDLMEK